jgi:fluoride exporter
MGIKSVPREAATDVCTSPRVLRSRVPFCMTKTPEPQGNTTLPHVDDDAARSQRVASRAVASRRRNRRAQGVIVLALGCGGVIGAIARYSVSLAFPVASDGIPWNTLLINLSGSALLGFLLILMIEQFPRGRLVRPVIGTGVIGAYTTFSTFSVEAILLVRGDDYATALAYVALSVVAGLIAVWVGMIVARLLIRAERWLQEEAS